MADPIAILEVPAAQATVEFPSGVIVVPGPAGASFVHTQAVAATLWTINHNLDVRPSVTTLTTGGLEMEGTVQHLSANTLTVSFLTPVAGTARLT